MVLDKLGESLKNTLAKITSAMFVDERLVNELVKDIQKALIQADVNIKLVLRLTTKIKDRALKEETPSGLTKKEWLVKIVYDELATFLGEEVHMDVSKEPTKIMLVGLFGNGKTTTAGKLAKYFQKRGHKIAMMSTDTWRPAAAAQLDQLGKQLNVPVFIEPKEKDPVRIYRKHEAELQKVDIAIIDTAGRDALSSDLIDELKVIRAAVQPDYTFLVLSADLGQAAEQQARAFHDTCDVNGIIITKMDGTAKGGGALIACAITGAHVAFIGVGEKLGDFEQFKPKNFVGRLLGMGDIEGLLEKATEAITEKDAQDLSAKLMKGEFSLIDLYEQMQAMKKMGSLSKLMDMIPGFSQVKLPKEFLLGQEGKIDTWKYVMDSCTKQELDDPDIIDAPRIERIAKGSGRSVGEVRDLLKQYRQSKKMMKMFKGASPKTMEKMMKKVQGGIQGMKMG